MVGFQVNIVATPQRLLAFRIDIGTKVVLVRRLVGREAGIAIEAIRTVLHPLSTHRRVKTGNPLQRPSHGMLPFSPHLVIFSLIGLIPLTVIVSHQFPEVR